MAKCMHHVHEGGASLREIFRLAWPQTLMMVAHFFIGFVDVLVAGKIDAEVQAALGIITQCLFFLLIVGIAVANGAVAVISQSMGACLDHRVRRYVGLSILLSLGLSGVILALGYGLRTPFLAALQVPERILPETRYFYDVYLAVLPSYYLLGAANAIFRAQKRVHIPLFSMVLITVVNTFLDFGLGLGMWGLPAVGYKGLAWATFGSVSAGALFNLVILHRLSLLKRASFPPLRWMRAAMPYLVKVAAPSGAMQALWQTGYLVLFAIVGALPVQAVSALAGLTAGMRIEAILFLPAFAFNMTASILVGNALGAGRPDQAKRVALEVMGIGVALVSLMGLALWGFVPELAAFLAPEATVQPHTVTYLHYNIVAIPFTAASMIMGGIMTGAGATIYTMVVFGCATWLVRLPLAYLIGHVLWGRAEGVWLAMLISQVLQATVMFALLLRGRWTRHAMRSGRNGRGSHGNGGNGGPASPALPPTATSTSRS
jgi:putative MATE family efflux protein